MTRTQQPSAEINSSPSIAILGGGLIGRLLAWRLLKLGLAVDIFEARAQEDQQSAAFVAAAMLAPMAEAVGTDNLFAEMGLASLPIWKSYVDELSAEGAGEGHAPIFFQQAGTMVVAHPRDMSLFQHFHTQLQRVVQNWKSALSCPSFIAIDDEGINRLEPALSGRFSQALFLPDEGQIDNRATMLALATSIMNHGGRIHWQSAINLEDVAERYAVVIDCRGIGAKDQWRGQGRLRGVRGEVLRVMCPDINLHRPIRLLHPRYPLYIAPKPHHECVVGATVLESDDESPMSVHSAMELLSALYTLHPAFGEARILQMQSGVRPTLTHHRPKIIQTALGQRSLWQINGLYRHGWMMAPIIVESSLFAITQAHFPRLPRHVCAPPLINFPDLIETL